MARNIIGLSALMVASMAFAQDGDALKIGFETDDYRSVSVYDTWEEIGRASCRERVFYSV